MKKIFLSLFTICFLSSLFALNKSKVIQTQSPIYEYLSILSAESKNTFTIESKPMNIEEIEFYLSLIDYENLKYDSKILFDKISDEVSSKKNIINNNEIYLSINPSITPELYFKSNPNVDWTMNRYLQDYIFSLPIITSFSDYITIETDLFLGKNYPAIHSPYNFCNIPLSGSDLEFNFPKVAYGSFGKKFNKWGFNLQLGKEGLEIGNTVFNSIIYDNTFQTDFYSSLSIYSEKIKYLISVSQIDNTKYLYMHTIDVHLIDSFKLGIIEGSLLNSSFELRYLNPFMIMHSFGSWYQYENYMNSNHYEYYSEGKFCALLGLNFDWIPIKGLRLYGLYAQNEILDLGGGRSDYDLSVPDSIGFQFGAEYTFHLPTAGLLKTNLEAVYTSPFLYIKQSPDWSLYSRHKDQNSGNYLSQWLGSPFGPDNISFQFAAQYIPLKNWKLYGWYVLSLKGENDFSIFNNKNEDNLYTYYPSVKYKLGEETNNQNDMDLAKSEGRNMNITGTVQQTHLIGIRMDYSITNNIKLSGMSSFSYVINNKHTQNLNEFNFEFTSSCKLSLY